MKRFLVVAAVLLSAKSAFAEQPAVPDKPGAAKPAAEKTADKPEGEKPPERKLIELHGYVQPQFGVTYKPQAVDRDRLDYGGLSSRAGLVISGQPFEHWSYTVHLSLDVRTLSILTDAKLVDQDGDGNADGVVTTKSTAAGTIFEDVTIAYDPFDFLTFKIGSFRMPFTLALRSSNTAQILANRSGATEVFQTGPDRGITAIGHFLEDRVVASLGVFTGSSLNLLPATTSERGLVYSLRVDGSPLGAMPKAETDFEHGPIKFGVGAGMLYRNGTRFGQQGYELTSIKDTRGSISVRASGYGFFVQAEALRRLSTDDVSSRPNRATGAYAQASYFQPFTDQVGMAAVGRLGTALEDELTLPRRSVFIEAGLALFPRWDAKIPESIRVLVEYQGERRVTSDERNHSVIGQVQLIF